jgi:hypothetical protein
VKWLEKTGNVFLLDADAGIDTKARNCHFQPGSDAHVPVFSVILPHCSAS